MCITPSRFRTGPVKVKTFQPVEDVVVTFYASEGAKIISAIQKRPLELLYRV